MKIDIERIKVDEAARIRKDIGDLAKLEESIRQVGLINPLLVDENNTLVAGFRRLRACRNLGWKEIEVKVVELGGDELKMLEAEAAENLFRKEFTHDEILRRLLYASVNEACKILEEGKAYRASDIDVMWLHGFGFPRYRGGLMFWADGIGAREVCRQIEEWHQRYGARWKPAALLQEIAGAGGSLREAKAQRPL